MSFFKNYLRPGPDDVKKKEMKEDKTSTSMELKQGAPRSPSIRSGFPSRPGSLYPDGDFRNEGRDSILDIKIDVMANWLHQQQLEKLWATELPGEGIVIKKSRDLFISCPANLQNEQNGFYDNIAALGVKVSLIYVSKFPKGTLC